MGINLSPSFLDPAFAAAILPLQQEARNDRSLEGQKDRTNRMRQIPRPSLDWIARHVMHAIKVGGEDCIGLGGDLDGIAQTPAGMDTISDYAKFAPLFQDAGLTPRQIDKICYGNFLRVFSDGLAAG